MHDFIPYGKQCIDDEDINAVIDVLKSDYLTTGPKVKEFEDVVKNYVGAKYAVAVSNGTAALHIACLAAGIKEGDEVIVSSMTFAASSNAVLYCNATPIFADIKENTYNIDINDIRKKITSKTKAIIAVDFTGQAVDIDEIRKICNENNLIFIEDGAHSLGSEYKGKKVGSLADMTTFSFHPVKPITTGEGGMVVTNDKCFYEKLLLFRSHGITRDKDIMINDNDEMWHYEQLELGYNYRITDICCALGISQMKKLDKYIKRRRQIVDLYNDAFKNDDRFIIPFEEEYSKSGCHIYVLRINEDNFKMSRKDVFKKLRELNIGVNVHYIPVYLHPYYQKLGYKSGFCEVAEYIYKYIITIPVHPMMSYDDVMYIINAIKGMK